MYSFTIPKQKAGTVVKVIVEKDKLTSEASTVVVRGELDPTTISQIDTTMTSVSGKAEPNATIQLNIGDNKYQEGTVGTDGLYSFTIPKQKAGTVVKVIVKKDKLISEASTVVVRGELDPTTISQIDTTMTSVSGKAEPNATIQLNIGDNKYQEGTVGTNGLYSFTIPKQKAGTVVKAIVKKDKLISEASTVVVRGELDPTTISQIDTTMTSVSGKAEPNATIQLNIGDNKYQEGTVGTNGLYSFTIPKQKAGTVVKVIVKKDKLISEASTVVVRGELDPTTISQIDTTMTSVSGKAEPNATIQLNIGDNKYQERTVGTDGLYSFTIPKQKAGTVVKVIVKKDKLTSEASTVVKLIANATITKVDEYKQGESNEVTGTYTGAGAKYISLVY
ncbi:Ig-like domain-containing protein [Enterococcus gallinarum]|nr:Ig-like domain-containing protein [Enterococcus gallinarum]